MPVLWSRLKFKKDLLKPLPEVKPQGADADIVEPAPVPSVPGVWIVHERKAADGKRDIFFKLCKPDGVTHEHVKLKSEVEKTLTAIYVIFGSKSEQSRFNDAFEKLLILSQLGLVGNNPSPSVAMGALSVLRNEIVERDSGRVKNDFLKKCGFISIVFAAPAALASIIIFKIYGAGFFQNLMMVWCGAMAGAWLSIASRKLDVGFDDLAKLEDDKLDPQIRLIFSGMLTLVLALFFASGILNVEIGKVKFNLWISSPITAVLLGVMAGISEKALPDHIVKKAAQIIK